MLLKCDANPMPTESYTAPRTEAEYNNLVKHNEAISKIYVRLSGNLVYHMDTTSTVHDLEEVRLALGGELLNFLGFSYGSEIAYEYAELFLDNFRALVADVVSDHASLAGSGEPESRG